MLSFARLLNESILYCITFADNDDTIELKKRQPTRTQNKLTTRSDVFVGTTCMEAGVICVMDQCKADKYWKRPLQSANARSGLLPLGETRESIQAWPVSLGADTEMKYQASHEVVP